MILLLFIIRSRFVGWNNFNRILNTKCYNIGLWHNEITDFSEASLELELLLYNLTLVNKDANRLIINPSPSFLKYISDERNKNTYVHYTFPLTEDLIIFNLPNLSSSLNESILFDQNTFDYVVNVDSMVASPHLLSECSNVMKPGGELLTSRIVVKNSIISEINSWIINKCFNIFGDDVINYKKIEKQITNLKLIVKEKKVLTKKTLDKFINKLLNGKLMYFNSYYNYMNPYDYMYIRVVKPYANESYNIL